MDLFDRTLTVSEANHVIHETVSDYFSALSIEGEISGYRPSQSKHWYFSLKDAYASIDAAVFRNMQFGMETPENGDLVVAKGSLSFYEKTGKLTFVITSMKKKGDGELAALIEKRKDYYRSLGWFDEDKKKPLPEEISILGVVTSPTGAAIRDIMNIVRRRAPSLRIIVFPAAVQGEGAAESIAMRIRQANLFSACDVLIVGRGGGSQEDLSCFSEPAVIEAIHESEIPVISAVGHEIDWPISDSVASKRAPTPSAAAEIATEAIYTRSARLTAAQFAVKTLIDKRLSEASHSLDNAIAVTKEFERKLLMLSSAIPSTEHLGHLLMLRIANASSRLGFAEDMIRSRIDAKSESARTRMNEAIRDCRLSFEESGRRREERMKSALMLSASAFSARLQEAERQRDALAKEIEALSPLSILSRGYSVTRGEDGMIIRQVSDAKPGDRITTIVSDGSISSVVEG